ncbi:hypothetical protein EDB83DRAFT_2530293 [Lactarius deliciosus]|nr:hypothetical protein EDB83DRAFT_2530293 [Lactarius deliciosus]
MCALDPGRDIIGAHTSQEGADAASPTATEDEGRDEAARLVLNYPIHHGYAKTAEALQAQSARVPTRAASHALPIPLPTSMSASRGTVGEPSMLEQRLLIVCSVRRGDIKGALNELGERFPDFVELVNAAAEVKRTLSSSATTPASHDGGEDADAMDVDDDAPAQAALADAAERPEVQALLEGTWNIIAHHFPADAGGDIGRWAGQDARDALAGEVNQAILESQGFPRRRPQDS